jgi:3-deoxy-manno-octulosonate cytidylyltransferase (CMP-KDO synthetase)
MASSISAGTDFSFTGHQVARIIESTPMSALIVIPARYGSTRFPGKPLVPIAGVSLIRRVYDQASRSARAEVVYVATDDERIRDHVAGFGGRVVMTGAAESGTDRIARALPEIERLEKHSFDIVVNVQGDEPLIDMESVDRMIDVLAAGAEIVTLAARLESDEEFRSPDVVKVVCDLQGQALYFSRAPIPAGGMALARRHVGIYGYRTPALLRYAALDPSPLEQAERLEQLRALQNQLKILVLETSRPHHGVDRPEDVARIERELASIDSL